MLQIGVIGAGRIGQVHAKTIAAHPGATLAAVSDPFGTAAQELASQYGATSTLDANDIFTNPDIDAVIICSPTQFHIEHIRQAVTNGKSVMCEKPVALAVDEAVAFARELEEMQASGTKVNVMMGFNRRFDPSFASLHARVQAGEIGKVEQIIITSRDPEAPPASYIAGSGGIFKDMTIHDFDMARFFLGDIATVFAVGQNMDPALADTGDYDGAFVTLTNAAGTVCSIINSRHCASGYDQRLEVFGDKGMLIAENVRATTVRAHTAAMSDAQDVYLDFFLQRYAEAYSLELTSFINTCLNDAVASPSVFDGVKALEIAEAALASAQSGASVTL